MKNLDANFSLHSPENYKKELTTDINIILKKITDLLIEYYKHSSVNIKFKNINYNKFIIKRGLDTLINIFSLLLYYTNNVDLAYYHCQKAQYFYCEFIDQITEYEKMIDEKNIIPITSREAVNYVYKKNIYTIPDEYRNFNNNEFDNNDYYKIKIDIINSYLYIYKTLFYKLIEINYFYKSDAINAINDINNNNSKINENFLEQLILITDKLNNLLDKSLIKIFSEVFDNLYFCLEKFYTLNNLNTNEYNIFFEISFIIIKKVIKNPNFINNINNNLKYYNKNNNNFSNNINIVDFMKLFDLTQSNIHYSK